jgi:predicted RNase H-like nuclease
MWSRALGVDACRAGWVGVVLHGGGAMVHVAETIAALVADAEAPVTLPSLVSIFRFGLPDTGRGAADVLAYQLVGPRRSSVFMTPVRAALEAGSHAAARTGTVRWCRRRSVP